MSAETEKLFKRLLKELRPLFKQHGFRAYGQNFILETPETWVIFNFQKSRWSDASQTTFYINVAASSRRWLGFHGKPPEKTPPYYSCDWSWRAEHFGPEPKTSKWTLSDPQRYEEVFAYLQNLLEKYVFPATESMMTEAQLVGNTGGFEFPQLKTQTVVHAATGQTKLLKSALGKLIEKYGSGSVSNGVANHLLYLRTSYPEAMKSAEHDSNHGHSRSSNLSAKGAPIYQPRATPWVSHT